LVTLVNQVAANGGSGAASIRNGGDLAIGSLSSLTGVTATGGVTVRTTGDLRVHANVTNAVSGNVLLQGDGSLIIDPAVTVQAPGILRLIAGFGALSFNSVLSFSGASLHATTALLNVGIDLGVTVHIVPGGATPIILDGGDDGLLELDDQGNTTSRTFTLTNTTVSWGGPTLTWTGLGTLTINGGSGGNTFNILTTSATAGVNLVGGVGGDTFQFADGASITGTITGGGSATLDYSAYSTSVVVDLQTGSATGVGGSVSGISSVLGGSATPAGASVYNLLIGNGGNTLTGGTGRRNILVAGGSASTLVAGDNEDLLIAGSTTYDTETGLGNWQQIAAYWAGSDDYATRVANLSSGTGVPLLDATVVTGNGGGNVLNGQGALALIFTDTSDTISGFDPNSMRIGITP
jgi:hypothetical protein